MGTHPILEVRVRPPEVFVRVLEIEEARRLKRRPMVLPVVVEV